MPLYEYKCTACAHRFERIMKFSDAPLKTCPKCGKDAVDQLISASAMVFKGSGWYETDYARKGRNYGSDSASSEPANSSEKSDSAKLTGGADSASASGNSNGGNGSGSGSSSESSTSSSADKSSGNGSNGSQPSSSATSSDSGSGAKSSSTMSSSTGDSK